ncbi:hypothetical protein L7F22_046215 [Adiantum nelumboides]|nr:hypothetical protein [Adiantum nelumboides]
MAQLRRLTMHFLFGGSNGSRDTRARVCWWTVILPTSKGGLGIIDPELQSRALLTKLNVRGLFPGNEPWKMLLQSALATATLTFGVRAGAALEAMTALCLQLHQDKLAMDYVVDFERLWEKEGALSADSENFGGIKYEALALRRLAELTNPTESLDTEGPSLSDAENVSGAAVLALAQFYHVQGNFSAAKEFYEKAFISSKKEGESSDHSLSSMSMVPEAVHVGAMAGLGQLLTATGNFEEAEQHLTHALNEMEKNKGEKDPQVGVILACLGNLYDQRGAAQGSSEMLITEGMYKSALDLMKAPLLDNVREQGGRLSEIVALTRARLGAVLAPAQNRRSEVYKLKDWVESTWKNSRPLPGTWTFK